MLHMYPSKSNDCCIQIRFILFLTNYRADRFNEMFNRDFNFIALKLNFVNIANQILLFVFTEMSVSNCSYKHTHYTDVLSTLRHKTSFFFV